MAAVVRVQEQFLAFVKAHVGISLLNAVPPSQTGDSSSKTSNPESKSGKSKKPMTESSHSAAPPKSSMVTTNNRHLTAAEKQCEKLKKMLDKMNEEGNGRAPPIVKLGDASMASPFTANHASVVPTLDIIRQGQSTLVTTLQMFKILGLNCLAIAHVLHSLLGQFAMHLFFLILAVNEASEHMADECIEPDSLSPQPCEHSVIYCEHDDPDYNLSCELHTWAIHSTRVYQKTSLSNTHCLLQ